MPHVVKWKQQKQMGANQVWKCVSKVEKHFRLYEDTQDTKLRFDKVRDCFLTSSPAQLRCHSLSFGPNKSQKSVAERKALNGDT